jgi:hypothetical protein
MIVCVITGFVKWPGLISTIGMSYRRVPLVLVTDLHIWSGLCIALLSAIHVFQLRGRMMRMIRSTGTVRKTAL